MGTRVRVTFSHSYREETNTPRMAEVFDDVLQARVDAGSVVIALSDTKGKVFAPGTWLTVEQEEVES